MRAWRSSGPLSQNGSAPSGGTRSLTCRRQRRLGCGCTRHTRQISGVGNATGGRAAVGARCRAAWWPHTRHFQVVRRLPAGGRHLEANNLGRWQPTVAQRNTLVLMFPRAQAAAVGGEGEQQRLLAQALVAEEAAGSPTSEPQRARQSAEEAAAERHSPSGGGAHGKGRGQQAQLRPPRAMLRAEETQVCHYRGVSCAGCAQQSYGGRNVARYGDLLR
eukprot:4032104-Prymnesium_polylepis.1